MQRLDGDGWVFVQMGGRVMRELAPASGCMSNRVPGPYTPTVDFDLETAGGVKSMLFGGEGVFFASLTGPQVWIQSCPSPGWRADHGRAGHAAVRTAARDRAGRSRRPDRRQQLGCAARCGLRSFSKPSGGSHARVDQDHRLHPGAGRRLDSGAKTGDVMPKDGKSILFWSPAEQAAAIAASRPFPTTWCTTGPRSPRCPRRPGPSPRSLHLQGKSYDTTAI